MMICIIDFFTGPPQTSLLLHKSRFEGVIFTRRNFPDGLIGLALRQLVEIKKKISASGSLISVT